MVRSEAARRTRRRGLAGLIAYRNIAPAAAMLGGLALIWTHGAAPSYHPVRTSVLGLSLVLPAGLPTSEPAAEDADTPPPTMDAMTQSDDSADAAGVAAIAADDGGVASDAGAQPQIVAPIVATYQAPAPVARVSDAAASPQQSVAAAAPPDVEVAGIDWEATAPDDAAIEPDVAAVAVAAEPESAPPAAVEAPAEQFAMPLGPELLPAAGSSPFAVPPRNESSWTPQATHNDFANTMAQPQTLPSGPYGSSTTGTSQTQGAQSPSTNYRGGSPAISMQPPSGQTGSTRVSR